MCRACINAAFWHFVFQSRCINSLRRLVAEDITLPRNMLEKHILTSACCGTERGQQYFYRH